jgi:hypothetical protein
MAIDKSDLKQILDNIFKIDESQNKHIDLVKRTQKQQKFTKKNTTNHFLKIINYFLVNFFIFKKIS